MRPIEASSVTRPWRLARAIIESLAERVSVSVFRWDKAPGNTYFSFYPTALLPDREQTDKLTDPDLAARIWDFAVLPMADPPRPVTLGVYGGEIAIPSWAAPGERRIWPPPAGAQAVPIEVMVELDVDEKASLAECLQVLDVDALCSNGSSDPEMTTTVLSWLDATIDELVREPEQLAVMDFERRGVPRDLCVLYLVARDNAARHRICWSGWAGI